MKKICMIALFFAFVASVPFYKINAQAHTYEQRIPSYALYCKDAEVIKGGTIKFDLTNSEMITQGVGTIHSDYQIGPVGFEVEFAIPFLSTAYNVPEFNVAMNGEMLEGKVCYGESAFAIETETDADLVTRIENTYSSVIDGSINGTLYTIKPDNGTMMVELSFIDDKRSAFIYAIRKCDSTNACSKRA